MPPFKRKIINVGLLIFKHDLPNTRTDPQMFITNWDRQNNGGSAFKYLPTLWNMLKIICKIANYILVSIGSYTLCDSNIFCWNVNSKVKLESLKNRSLFHFCGIANYFSINVYPWHQLRRKDQSNWVVKEKWKLIIWPCHF